MEKVSVMVIDPKDNVGIALSEALPAGETVFSGGRAIKALDRIPTGHKIAISDIDPGGYIIKFGEVIGQAKRPIKKGEHVHIHNVLDITEQLAQQSKKGGEA